MQRQLFSILIWMAVKIEENNERKKLIISDYENWSSFYLNTCPIVSSAMYVKSYTFSSSSLPTSWQATVNSYLWSWQSLLNILTLCASSPPQSFLHSRAKVIIFNDKGYHGFPLLNILDWVYIVSMMKSTFSVCPHRSGWCGPCLFSSFISQNPPLLMLL